MATDEVAMAALARETGRDIAEIRDLLVDYEVRRITEHVFLIHPIQRDEPHSRLLRAIFGKGAVR